MFSLKNKIVMITGATGGFGSAFAHKFAEAGCKLILTSRKQDKLDKLVKELKVPAHKIIMDVRNRKEIESAFAALPKDFQDIDILINNAGGAFGMSPAYEDNLDDIENMIKTNDIGLAVCTRMALPSMVARKRGHIINIGSVSGTYPYPGGAVYCAVKAFVKQFSLCLKAELIGTGVRVTNIEPGMAETDFSLNRFHGDASKAAKVYENANPMTAEDVAEAVFFAATMPAHVNINRIELMPTTQGPGPLAVYRGG
jgi:3-hydroxy acid dehydrogenase / malonic semialdehyde reductase